MSDFLLFLAVIAAVVLGVLALGFLTVVALLMGFWFKLGLVVALGYGLFRLMKWIGI